MGVLGAVRAGSDDGEVDAVIVAQAAEAVEAIADNCLDLDLAELLVMVLCEADPRVLDPNDVWFESALKPQLSWLGHGSFEDRCYPRSRSPSWLW